MNVYFIQIDKLKERSFLDANIDDKTIKIGLRNAQEQILEPIIGTKLYEKIGLGISQGDLELKYQNLLVQKIWPVLIHATTYMVSRNILFRYTNSSIVKDDNENSRSIERRDLETLRMEEESAYKYHAKKLTAHLRANLSTYPEYTAYDLDDVRAEQSQTGLNFYSDVDDVTYDYYNKNYEK